MIVTLGKFVVIRYVKLTVLAVAELAHNVKDGVASAKLPVRLAVTAILPGQSMIVQPGNHVVIQADTQQVVQTAHRAEDNVDQAAMWEKGLLAFRILFAIAQNNAVFHLAEGAEQVIIVLRLEFVRPIVLLGGYRRLMLLRIAHLVTLAVNRLDQARVALERLVQALLIAPVAVVIIQQVWAGLVRRPAYAAVAAQLPAVPVD